MRGRHTHRLGSSTLKFANVAKTLQTKTSRTSLSNIFKVNDKVIETSMNMYAMHVDRHAVWGAREG